MLTVTNTGTIAILTAVAPANTVFQTMGLYVNPIRPDPTLTLADLVEPVGGWYTRQPLTFPTPPFINALGKAQMNAPSFTWVTGAPEPTVTVYGAFWINNTADLIAIDPFDVPISLVAGGQSIPYQPTCTAVEDA